jgi:hypothetical protein
MKKYIIPIFILMAFLCGLSLSYCEPIGSDKSNKSSSELDERTLQVIKTRYGDFKEIYLQSNDIELSIKLTFNGKMIEAGMITIVKYFEEISPDVVILLQELGGSHCDGKYKFITIRKDGSVTKSETIGNCMRANIKVERSKIIMRFPYDKTDKYKAEKWVYMDGILSKVK